MKNCYTEEFYLLLINMMLLKKIIMFVACLKFPRCYVPLDTWNADAYGY